MGILQVKQVHKSFGGVKANVDISFDVPQGAIVGLIGPNGSGKSTLFGSIVGAFPIDSGRIIFQDEDITSFSGRDIARRGLIRTFQQTRIYGGIDCLKNMYISIPRASDWRRLFHKPPAEADEKIAHLLEFVGLYNKRHHRAGELSFGQQKLLELAMALMNNPKMIMLDEPTAGINPTLINGVIERLQVVNEEHGVTLLVIEHNMRVIMNLAQTILCLAHGELLATGDAQAIRNNKRVIEAYLGA